MPNLQHVIVYMKPYGSLTKSGLTEPLLFLFNPR